MSVTGLAEVLESMMMSVIQSHELRNWSIFEDNGSVTFKIRFNIVECQGQNSQQPAKSTVFRIGKNRKNKSLVIINVL